MPKPKLKIDAEQVKKLAAKQWTYREIAAFFNTSEATICRRFVTQISLGRASGTSLLRDMLWRRAQEGSDRVLLLLAKEYLGMGEAESPQATFNQVNIGPQQQINTTEFIRTLLQRRQDAIQITEAKGLDNGTQISNGDETTKADGITGSQSVTKS